MPSVISKTDKLGKTRRLFFNQIRDKFEGWRAGKARLRASREKNMTNEGWESAKAYYAQKDWEKFHARFTELHGYILQRMHKKIDYAKVDPNSRACLPDKQYWEGFNAGLDWAHRIVNGDKSAD